VQERRTASQAFFSSRAGQWDRVRAELYGSGTEVAPLAALLDPSWIVADLGCGTGQTSAAVAPYVAQVIAVDESSAMLAAARKRLGDLDNVDLRTGRLEDLPIDDASADVAVLSLVLHVVVDPAAVIAESARILRPGGRLLVVDMLPHERDEYRTTMGHLWLGFSDAQLDAWFTGAGLRDMRIVPLAPDPHARGPNLFTARAVKRAEHS